MKIHAGCGTVYLSGYINIDAAPHFLSKESSTLAIETLNQNKTTFENYYKTDFNDRPHCVIADVKSLIDSMPFDDESAEEIVMLHVLEHFPHYKIDDLLNEINRVLKKGGKFIVGVPDIKKTAEGLAKAATPEEEDWYIRLIHGTQRNEFSHHYCGYTERTLKDLLSKYNFGNFEILPNINFYPAIHLKAYKEINND